jgi:hypothetical protein
VVLLPISNLFSVRRTQGHDSSLGSLGRSVVTVIRDGGAAAVAAVACHSLSCETEEGRQQEEEAAFFRLITCRAQRYQIVALNACRTIVSRYIVLEQTF